MGRVKDYLIWHQGKYGVTPTNMSLVDEFLGDERQQREEWEASKLTRSQISELSIEAPSLKLLLAIQRQEIGLHDLEWMQFEDLVAELLSKDGFEVKLGKRRKDEGVDIFAEKHLDGVGRILSVWQAKKLAQKNKVGVSTIRELADTRNEFKASKGIIVTNTALTNGAIKRVIRDQYILGKIEGDDLIKWIMSRDLAK